MYLMVQQKKLQLHVLRILPEAETSLFSQQARAVRKYNGIHRILQKLPSIS